MIPIIERQKQENRDCKASWAILRDVFSNFCPKIRSGPKYLLINKVNEIK